MKHIIASALSMICALVALSGCNTMRGLGQDVEKAGEAIQKAVNR